MSGLPLLPTESRPTMLEASLGRSSLVRGSEDVGHPLSFDDYPVASGSGESGTETYE